MSKNPEPTRPLSETKPDFERSLRSLNEYMNQADMLADAVSLLLIPSLSGRVQIPDVVAKLLRERLAAFNRARFGEGSD